MATTTACPQASDLKQLTTGDVPAEQLECLLTHLEDCESCLAKVESLSSPDTLLDVLTKTTTRNDEPDEAVVAQLIARLKSLGQLATPQTLTFSCADCGKKMKVKVELAGKKVKCPGCGKAVAAPASARTQVSEQNTVQPSNVDATVDTPARAGTNGNATYAIPRGGVDSGVWDFLAPAEQPDELGRLGPYRVLQVLGAGGMGVVFRAEDPHLERAVALKAMLPALAASASAKKRFLREAKAAAALKHDNVVAIYQVGEDRGTPFLAMEFLDGEPLDKCLEREVRLSVGETVRLGKQIAEGLAAAHDKGLIHRDIKPGNIWLESRGTASGKKTTVHDSPPHTHHARVKILDFGLARSVADQTGLTQQGAMVGTPAYMAPEQAIGKDVDQRSDLFSLGCVLYKMATGRMPFKGNDTLSILSSLAMDEPKTPQELDPMLPAELSDLIMQLLAKKAEDRPVSAQAVIERLNALAADDAPPTQANRNATPLTSAAPPRKRGFVPWAVGILGGFLLLLLGGGVFYIVTDNGTIEIKTGDPAVKIIVEQNGKQVTILDPASKQTWVLNTGKYSLRLDGNPDGLEIDLPKERSFEMKRGGKQVVSISRKVRGLVAKVDAKKLPRRQASAGRRRLAQ